MENVFNLDKEKSLYHRFPAFWSSTVLVFVLLAFVLSDWVILNTSFGDFILAFVVFLLIILKQIYYSRQQLYIATIPVIAVVLNFILNYFFNNEWFNIKIWTLSAAKVFLYLATIFLLYNFIRQNDLQIKMLKMNNTVALLVILLGIILTISIYLDIPEFHDSIWTFTRTDNMSYYFIGNENIVRTRSIFSEPAHLGYYLNITFFANLFYKKKKNNLLVLTIIAVGIVSTLSYSMIAILGVTFVLYLVMQLIKGEYSWSNWYLLIVLFGAVFVFIFWDFIYVTIIERTINILNGTDGSAYNRIVESWMYVPKDRLWIGNGMGHTPPVTNIFAYILSELGLLAFIPYLIFTGFLLVSNIPLGVFFVTMNLAKGGYLNPMFWIFILFILVFCLRGNTKRSERY